MGIKVNFFFLFAIVIFFSSNKVFSQTIINGFVISKNNKPISFVNVSLKDLKNENITSYAITNQQGYYSLKTYNTGDFDLNFSKLNFKSNTVLVKITNQIEISLPKVTLENQITDLQEVVIKSEKKIVNKKDTVIYNLKAFKQGNEKVLEDLLKKLPGFEVTTNGKITVRGKEIEKIMVEGDDFFEKGYTILSKNMPVESIEKLEVIENYESNKYLKNIRNSDKIALNLKLNDESKNIWFGDAELNYGVISENRYKLSNNLMKFSKKAKHYFLSNLNNIGLDATGDLNFLSNLKNNENLVFFNIDESEKLKVNQLKPNLDYDKVNINNSELFSLNNIFNLSKKAKIKLTGLFNSDNIFSSGKTLETFSTNRQFIQLREQNDLIKDQYLSNIKLDFSKDFSKDSSLEFNNNLNFNKLNDHNRNNFNGLNLDENLETNNKSLNSKVFFTKKVNDKTVILIKNNLEIIEKTQIFTTNPFIYVSLLNINAQSSSQFYNAKTLKNEIEATLINKHARNNILELKLGNLNNNYLINSKFNLKENSSEKEFFINNNEINSFNPFIKLKYTLNRKDLKFVFGLDQIISFSNLTLNDTKTDQFFYAINPKIGVDWKINTKTKITSFLSSEKSIYPIENTYNQFINSSFRKFELGLDKLYSTSKKSVLVNFKYGNLGDGFTNDLSFIYSKQDNFSSSNTFLTPNFILDKKTILGDKDFMGLNTRFGIYIKKIKNNFKVNFDLSNSISNSLLNDFESRNIKQTDLNYGLEFRSGFKSFFNYNFGYNTNIKYINVNLIKNRIINNVGFIDLYFKFNERFKFNTKYQIYVFNSGNIKTNHNFLDLDFQFTPKNKKIEFGFLIKNLFNTNSFKSFSSTDLSFTESEITIQPRFLLLSTIFRF